MVPDSFEKNHIKEVMNILLCKLGFSSVIIHQVRKNELIPVQFYCMQVAAQTWVVIRHFPSL